VIGRRLGIEVASDRLITVTVSRGRISHAGTVPLPRGDASTETLPLQPRFAAAPVHVAISNPDDLHRVLTLPPMTARERTEVVNRERVRDSEEARVIASHLVRRVTVEGLPKDELLVVLASPERLQESLAPIIKGGAIPRAVVTGPMALLAAARALVPTGLDRPTALAHWGPSTLTIVVVSEGVLKFARVVAPPASALDPFDWIPVEIDRSIRHYAVLSKGERVEQAIVSVADAAATRRLFADAELSGRLRLPVTNLNVLLEPELPNPWEEEMAAGVFTLAYGAALLGAGDAPNLLPPEFALHWRSRRVIAAAAAVGTAAVLLLTASALSLGQQAHGLRDRRARAQTVVQQSQASLDAGQQAEADREQMRQVARLLVDDPLNVIPPADPLREIARLAPPQVRLEHLTVAADGQGYAFSLIGQVEQSDVTDAHRALNEFYFRLRDSPLFYAVTVQQTPRAISPVAATAETAQPAARPADDVPSPALGFTLVVRLKRLA
jgi:Tfp pilus assembly protein PilN